MRGTRFFGSATVDRRARKQALLGRGLPGSRIQAALAKGRRRGFAQAACTSTVHDTPLCALHARIYTRLSQDREGDVKPPKNLRHSMSHLTDSTRASILHKAHKQGKALGIGESLEEPGES